VNQRRRSGGFTEASKKNYNHAADQLQRLNALAAQNLIMLGSRCSDHRKKQKVYAELSRAVLLMTCSVRCCELLARESPRQITSINVIVGMSCCYCDSTPYRNRDRSRIDTLDPNPAWGIQIEALLALAIATIHRAIGQEISSLSRSETIPACLDDLIKVCRRQLRHLEEINGVPVPEIVVRVDHNQFCVKCGNRYGIFSEQDEDSGKDVENMYDPERKKA
jgi:hypothetical protein